MGRPLKITKAQAVLTITDTTAATGQVTVLENLSTSGVIAGMPFVAAEATGGLSAGVTYWILNIVDNFNFTVSATSLSANPTFTAVELTDTSSTTIAASVGMVNQGFNNPSGIANTYGVVGGNTAIYGNQVLCRVALGVNGVGTITVATDSANITGVGTDFANTLTDGTMLTTAAGTVLGVIADIANANATFATFAANAASNVTAGSYVYTTNEPGFIIRQKGKQKYLVKGVNSGLIGQCQTANLANANLTPNTMNIVASYANSATAFVQSLSDVNLEIFGNSAPLLQNASPAYATFNSAAAANVSLGIAYPIVSINKE